MICDFGPVNSVFNTGPWLHDTWWKLYKVIVHKGGIEDEQVSTSIGNTVCLWLFLHGLKSSSIIQKHVKERHLRNTSWFWHYDFQQNIYSHIIIINAAEVHIFKKTGGETNRFGVSPESASEEANGGGWVTERMRSKKGGVHRNDMFSLKVMNFVKVHQKFQVPKMEVLNWTL